MKVRKRSDRKSFILCSLRLHQRIAHHRIYDHARSISYSLLGHTVSTAFCIINTGSAGKATKKVRVLLSGRDLS